MSNTTRLMVGNPILVTTAPEVSSASALAWTGAELAVSSCTLAGR
jgi:hypothetical protein